jgi:hypothetical protein
MAVLVQGDNGQPRLFAMYGRGDDCGRRLVAAGVA